VITVTLYMDSCTTTFSYVHAGVTEIQSQPEQSMKL